MTVSPEQDARPIQKSPSPAFWRDTKRRVADGRVMPFISNYMSAALFGLARGYLATQWAKEIGSPFAEVDNREIAHVAQYYAVTLQEEGPLRAKQDYLNWLTQYLLRIASKDSSVEQDLVQEFLAGFEQNTTFPKPFSEIARDLGYPRFDGPEADPFRLLAEMPLPIYITTSHHQFLEYALAQTQNKTPVSEIFYWGDHLESIKSRFDEDPDWEPTVAEPLVYHLYGLDEHPESLVLTEDDFLDLLDKLAELRYQVKLAETAPQGALRRRRDLPAAVRMALSGNALLTLGYSVVTWEFRVLFRGLIQSSRENRHSRNAPSGICMQIKPGDVDGIEGDADGISSYLEQYFKDVDFRVFWGSVEDCVFGLWDLWQR